jgi:hypothetical protein
VFGRLFYFGACFGKTVNFGAYNNVKLHYYLREQRQRMGRGGQRLHRWELPGSNGGTGGTAVYTPLYIHPWHCLNPRPRHCGKSICEMSLAAARAGIVRVRRAYARTTNGGGMRRSRGRGSDQQVRGWLPARLELPLPALAGRNNSRGALPPPVL